MNSARCCATTHSHYDSSFAQAALVKESVHPRRRRPLHAGHADHAEPPHSAAAALPPPPKRR